MSRPSAPRALDATTPMLSLRLFGGFEAFVGPKPVAFATRHVAQLLARLALAPDAAHPRQQLAAVIWPDRSEEQSRSSLRQAVYRLRTALQEAEPFPLESTPRSLLLRREVVHTDPAEFDAPEQETARRDPA